MEQYIPKAALVAEIENYKNSIEKDGEHCSLVVGKHKGQRMASEHFLSFIDTIEVKEVDTWHLQKKENIYDAVKDWGPYTFACLMKDGSIQKFTGNLDEDCEGHINVHINGVNDDYDNVDDIVKWIELT